ncbi:MAG: DUF421 domain-containing protein [Vicinamibacterales bacterium]
MAFASDRDIRKEAWLHRLGCAAFVAVAAAAGAGAFGERGAVVIRATAIYLFLLIVFRIAGRRTLAQTTSFDLVLILIIGDATQQALLGEDNTLAGGALAVLTLVALDVSLAYLKRLFPVLDRLIEGAPVMIVANGQPREAAMAANVLDVDDVIAAARENHGLTDLAHIREAVLEKDGKISVIPARGIRP